jgi:hypothetical protein
MLFIAHSTTLTAAPGQSQVESSSRAQLVQQIGCVNKLYKHLNGMITMETILEYGRARRIKERALGREIQTPLAARRGFITTFNEVVTRSFL